MLILFPHTNLSALVGSTVKQKIQIHNFSLCAVLIFTHTHTQDLEQMSFSLHIVLDCLSFPLKYRLSFGTQPADFRRRCCWAAVRCCAGTQYPLTHKEKNSSHVYHEHARGYHQCLLCVEDKQISRQTLSSTMSSLAKGKITYLQSIVQPALCTCALLYVKLTVKVIKRRFKRNHEPTTRKLVLFVSPKFSIHIETASFPASFSGY